MKIGMISDTFLPQIGGAEVHVYNLGCALRNLSHDVKIFTNTEGEGVVNGFKVVRNNLKKSGFKTLVTLLNLRSFITEVDVVHCHYTFFLSSLACPLAKMLRKPSIVTLHGLGTLDSSVGNSFRMKACRWISFKFADAIIATSGEMAEVAKRFTKEEKIHVIPNGVNTDYFKPSHAPNLNKDKLIVLSVRRLNLKNGVQYLIEAIPYVIEKFNNEKVEFWIMGKAKLESYLRKRVKELNIENCVKFVGEIPNESTKEYYEMADVVVFPSSAESTSIAALEAMAMERGVIASSLKAYKELLGENERGLLVTLFDRDYSDYNAPLSLPEERLQCLADAIVTLLRDKVLRQELGRKARKCVEENYDWKIITNKVIKIYGACLSKR